MTPLPADEAVKMLREALDELQRVVIAKNRDGADWGKHFGPLVTALGNASSAIAATTNIEQAVPVSAIDRTTLEPMGDKGRSWYFDCDGHFIDVEKDENGKYSVYFRDRENGKEAWIDQSDILPSTTDIAPPVPSDDLPPLPDPTIDGSVMHPYLHICYTAPVHYTATQMRQYAMLARSAVVVPDGWKLVPIEPTPEMIEHVFTHHATEILAENVEWFLDDWRLALEAAPNFTAQQGEG